MKPLHIGLLAAGAGLAGALAVKMTQLQLPVMAGPSGRAGVALQAPMRPTSQIPRAQIPTSQIPNSSQAPETRPKPSPLRDLEASAPPPIYIEPPRSEPHRWTKPIRKNEPNSVQASAIHTFPVPVPYEPPAVAPAPPVPEKQPEPAPQAAEKRQEPPPAAARKAILRTGVSIAIRIREPLSSERNTPGDVFRAALAEPLVTDGLVIAEKGARITGRVIEARRQGEGPARMELSLVSLITSDGQTVSISTEPMMREGRPVNVSTETLIRFRLAETVTITEQI